MALYVNPSVECSLTLIGNDVLSPGSGLDVGSEFALTLLACIEEIDHMIYSTHTTDIHTQSRTKLIWKSCTVQH